MQPLLILGSTIFPEEVADLAEDCGSFEVAGFVENLDPERCRQPLLGKPVHWVDDLAQVGSGHALLCGIGTTKRRRYVEQVEPFGLPFATLIHPSAHVSRTSTVGEGCILGVNTVVASHTRLGRHVIVNRGASVGHHTRIGDYVTISPGAMVAGRCEVGDGSYIAMGAIVIDSIKIGRNSVIGAGAVVTRDVPDNVQVLGMPARVVKENIEGR
ncbi:MAG: acetyltransferase [Thiobacillus sp.]|nr:acetyltransferase [Thiobacillus sp.]